MKIQYSILILIFCLFCSCSSHFDKNKWSQKGNEYKREQQIEVLCKKILLPGDKRENIISKLGEPDTNNSLVDSTYKYYGTIQMHDPFDIVNKQFINNDTQYKSIINTRRSDTLTIDRYIIGFNGSGPNYMLLCYDKAHKLTHILFEMTEF